MGLGMVVTCNNCGFSKNIFTGTGMHNPMLFEICNELNKSERIRVEALIKADAIADYEYYRELYKCPKCDALTDKCRLTLTLKDGTTSEVIHRCGRCKKAYELIENHDLIKTFKCPKCHEQSLVFDHSILWD
ncbi:MAG: hypothetical protein ACM3TR_12790 [Caulobacteraceae bacterium]